MIFLLDYFIKCPCKPTLPWNGKAATSRSTLSCNVLECTDSPSSSSVLFAFVYVSFEQGRQWMSNWMSFPPSLQEPHYILGPPHLSYLHNLCPHSLRGAANHSLPLLLNLHLPSPYITRPPPKCRRRRRRHCCCRYRDRLKSML